MAAGNGERAVMMEKLLDRLVQRLKTAEGENLRSIVLYGSAASGDFQPKHSDLNVVCLLNRLDPVNLSEMRDTAKWWVKKGHPAPLVFTFEELQRAADIYAIELVEIKNRRRLLYGEDAFESFDPPMRLHRLQVERELRHNLIRLRQNYIMVAGDRRAVAALMARSVSTFSLLFRHVLIALGETPPGSKHEAVERLAALLGFSTTSFSEIFKIRNGELKGKRPDTQLIFRDYLESVTRAVEEVDRRLSN